MKQAICLLAYRPIQYIRAFIEQFKNNPDILFYIHWHMHTEEECEELKNTNTNIKYVCNKYDTVRFSADLIMAEMHLYQMAAKNDEIAYCHLMSESDYLICSPDFFVNSFNKSSEYNYMTFITNDVRFNRYIDMVWDNSYPCYKASQWKSLNMETVKILVENKNFIENLISKCLDKMSKFGLPAALDEIIIPSFIKNSPQINSKFEILSANRYINWYCCPSHPNTLTYTKYKLVNIFHIYDDDIISNLIVRKIDIFKDDSKRFLDIIHAKFNEKIVK
jgi:hypothetical protein